MKLFKKVDLDLVDKVDIQRLKGKFHTSYGKFPNPVLAYYHIKDEEYLNSLLPDNMPWDSIPPFSVKYVELVCTRPGHLLPHIDHDISTCANFYINTVDSTTYFYQCRQDSQGFIYPGRLTANIFTFDQVERLSSFCANDNELYFLDVSKIHSVETPKSGIRQFISWQWKNTEFDKIIAGIDNTQK